MEYINELIDFVAQILKAQGFPSDQIVPFLEFLKGVLKIVIGVIKVVVPEQN